jgi:hypothetical protein
MILPLKFNSMAVNCDLTNHLWLWPAAARGSIIHSFIHWFVGLKLALRSQIVKVRIKTLALLFLCGNDNKGLPWNNALFKIFALREHSLWSLTNYIFKVYSLSFFFFWTLSCMIGLKEPNYPTNLGGSNLFRI